MSIVFQNQTADGTSDPFDHRGGVVQIQITGDLDGGTIQPRVAQEGLPLTLLVGIIYSEADVNRLFVAPGCTIDLVASGVGGSANFSASIAPA